MWPLISIKFYHIIYLTSKEYFFDNRFKTFLSITPNVTEKNLVYTKFVKDY